MNGSVKEEYERVYGGDRGECEVCMRESMSVCIRTRELIALIVCEDESELA